MFDLSVRDAVASDRNAIVTFDRIAQEDPKRVEFIDTALRSATCLVAERDGRVVAYGVLDYTFFGNGFVSMVYVGAAARRQGVGRRLMEALADKCRTPKLFTSTNESNVPMQRLLESIGYVPSGVVENLDPGDPELFYFLDLAGETQCEFAPRT